MDILTWLASTAARLVAPRLTTSILGTADDKAERKAIDNAAGVIAVRVQEASGEPVTEERTLHLKRTLVETLGRTEGTLQRLDDPASPRASLIDGFRTALMPLDESGIGFRDLGFSVSSDEVAKMFVDELTENLFLWSGQGHAVRDVAVLLQLDRMQANLAAASVGLQGPPLPVVRAWITVETSPPTIEVYNEGDSPIFEVVPTPTLIAQDLDGRIVAVLGAAALTSSRAAQISPGHGYAWRLDHMPSGSMSPLVSSQLHLDFTDNAGRRWRLAHDHLAQLWEGLRSDDEG